MNKQSSPLLGRAWCVCVNICVITWVCSPLKLTRNRTHLHTETLSHLRAHLSNSHSSEQFPAAFNCPSSVLVPQTPNTHSLSAAYLVDNPFFSPLSHHATDFFCYDCACESTHYIPFCLVLIISEQHAQTPACLHGTWSVSVQLKANDARSKHFLCLIRHGFPSYAHTHAYIQTTMSLNV